MLVDVYDTDARTWHARAVELAAVCPDSAMLADALDQLAERGAATVVTPAARIFKITPTLGPPAPH